MPINAGTKLVEVKRVGLDTWCRCLQHSDSVTGDIIPWRVMQINAGCYFEKGAVEGHPVEVESQVVREVDTDVRLGGHRVESVF
jgi:hypothetical protein